jgi:hypothetical protein
LIVVVVDGGGVCGFLRVGRGGLGGAVGLGFAPLDGGCCFWGVLVVDAGDEARRPRERAWN